MSTYTTAAILPVTRAQAAEYMILFVNRRAYLRQGHYPSKKSGRFYFYKVCDRVSKQPLSIDTATVQSHLAGHLTIGVYAINPDSQCSKWIVIDADYADARRDLLRLQEAFRENGIEALIEQSRRGGHLWIFLAEPSPAKLCRLYALNVARRLGIAIKQNKEDGIEVFPRQDELQPGEFGNAIRGPLGVHRASMERYWFEDAGQPLKRSFSCFARSNGSLGRNSKPSPPECHPSRPQSPRCPGSNRLPLKARSMASISSATSAPTGAAARTTWRNVHRAPNVGRTGMELISRSPLPNPACTTAGPGGTKEMIRSAVGCPISSSARFARTA